jgi:hypothetical protein
MTDSMWPDGKGGEPLPQPDVTFATSETAPGQFTPAAVKGMLVNPMYAGFGPFPRIVSDEMWVQAAAKLISDDGAEQFLVNLLYILRASFQEE